MILVSGCLSANQQETESPVEEKIEEDVVQEQPIEEQEPAQELQEPNIREFTITAKKYSFSPSTLTVNKGETVRISITSTDVAHGFAIKEFKINEKLAKGKETIIEFVADKAGTFRFYCSAYCGSGHGGMAGQLIVQE